MIFGTILDEVGIDEENFREVIVQKILCCTLIKLKLFFSVLKKSFSTKEWINLTYRLQNKQFDCIGYYTSIIRNACTLFMLHLFHSFDDA